MSKPLCQRSITVNLRPELDEYVRRSSKSRGVSMNEIMNQAVDMYRGRKNNGQKER